MTTEEAGTRAAAKGMAARLGSKLPEALRRYHAAILRAEGAEVSAAADAAGLTPPTVAKIDATMSPEAAVFGVSVGEALSSDRRRRLVKNLGQLVLGELAEHEFERIYKSTLGTTELVLEDHRTGRTETDYRVLNGSGLPVFRVNIKFHGTLFRKAKELVGLEPEDCFALATYKIWQGLQKEEKETLPYLFVVVSLPGTHGEVVGNELPEELQTILLLSAISKKSKGKREVEEALVRFSCSNAAPPEIRERLTKVREELMKAEWRIFSATRANRLLREKLFDRVFAVRVRGFAQNYRNAELDMHFSMAGDMKTLGEFLDLYKRTGIQGVTAALSRGHL